MIIELFTQYAPKTTANFLKICQGGAVNPSSEKLSYIGTEFSRVVKGMYVQGGDISKASAISKSKYNPKNFVENGASVYGGEFADESFQVKHTEVGLVGMCKRSSFARSNECQFYVTCAAPLSFMDSKYVIFGRVIAGMRAFKIMQKLELINEKPAQAVKIVGTGEYKIGGMKSKKGGEDAEGDAQEA